MRSTLELRSPFAPAVPDLEDVDPVLRWVDLEIDVTTRLREQDPPQGWISRRRKCLTRAVRRLESYDRFKKLASENCRIVSAFAPARIDPIGGARCPLRDESLHDLATSLSANAWASSVRVFFLKL